MCITLLLTKLHAGFVNEKESVYCCFPPGCAAVEASPTGESATTRVAGAEATTPTSTVVTAAPSLVATTTTCSRPTTTCRRPTTTCRRPTTHAYTSALSLTLVTRKLDVHYLY